MSHRYGGYIPHLNVNESDFFFYLQFQQISCYLPQGRISTSCVISVLRKDRTCKYIFNVSWKIKSAIQAHDKGCCWRFFPPQSFSDSNEIMFSQRCYKSMANAIDPSRKSQNASVPYPTMQHFVTEMCTFLLQNVALWDICLMHCGICEMGYHVT